MNDGDGTRPRRTVKTPGGRTMELVWDERERVWVTESIGYKYGEPTLPRDQEAADRARTYAQMVRRLPAGQRRRDTRATVWCVTGKHRMITIYLFRGEYLAVPTSAAVDRRARYDGETRGQPVFDYPEPVLLSYVWRPGVPSTTTVSCAECEPQASDHLVSLKELVMVLNSTGHRDFTVSRRMLSYLEDQPDDG